MKSRKPELNIGMIGHVDHGKTTLAKALSGEWTDRHSEEIKRGISIKLGYADCKFYRCPNCEVPVCYTTSSKCGHCGTKTEFLRAVSFVDSPGHETLMATMLSGAALMDGALLIIAANETCPQPQTKEHLTALEIIGVKQIVVVQNKIDTVDEKTLLANYRQICSFTNGTIAENAPIIPVSAQHDINIDVLIQAVEEKIKSPERDETLDARMYVARSFDVNKPGTRPNELVGGVIGGSLYQGKLRVNDEVEIKPVGEGALTTRIVRLVAGGAKLKSVGPGGLVAIGTTLDPASAKSDGLASKVAGKPGTLPQLWNEITVEVKLLERVVGASKDMPVENIAMNEALMLNVGVTTTVGVVTSVRDDRTTLSLKLPICADKGHHIAISRKIGGRWRLIGYGIIM